MMRLALLYRLAIPIFLTLALGTVFFRMLIPIVLSMAVARLLLLVIRITGNRVGKEGEKADRRGKFIDSSYRILDDSEDSTK